jgi:hypothetical protein
MIIMDKTVNVTIENSPSMVYGREKTSKKGSTINPNSVYLSNSLLLLEVYVVTNYLMRDLLFG